MLSAIAGWIIVLLFVVFVWRFVARLWHKSEEPTGPVWPADNANVPASIRPRPNLNAGAVAVEEPDEDH
jgi:hypothetical protein